MKPAGTEVPTRLQFLLLPTTPAPPTARRSLSTSTEKTEAIVVRQVDFSETSKVVTIFSRDFGKVGALAKGARRLKGPFEGSIDLCSTVDVVFIKKSSGSLDLLTAASLVRRFRPTPGQIKSLYGGYYIAELLDGLTEDYDPHPELYDFAKTSLARLEEAPDPALAIVEFELAILREIGQLPSFAACERCGEPVGTNASFVFWVSQNGLLCPRCQKDEYRQHPVKAGTLAVLRRLADPEIDTGSLNVRPEQFREIRRVVTQMLSAALGRRPKMARYLFG